MVSPRAVAWFNEGCRAITLRQAQDALQFFARAAADSPDFADALTNVKYVLTHSSALPPSLRASEAYNTGCGELGRKNYDAALLAFCRALAAADVSEDLRSAALQNLSYMFTVMDRPEGIGEIGVAIARLDGGALPQAYDAIDRTLQRLAETLLENPS